MIPNITSFRCEDADIGHDRLRAVENRGYNVPSWVSKAYDTECAQRHGVDVGQRTLLLYQAEAGLTQTEAMIAD